MHDSISWPSVLICLAIGLALSALMLIRSIVANDGYLSPDSTNYLALATNLSEGRGFLFASDGRFPAAYHPFADWPVGYPVLIHLLSAAMGISPFLGSKLVNAAMLISSAVLVGAVFGRNGSIYALTLGFASHLDIFSYSWSEGPFICLLVLAAILLSGLIGHARNGAVVRSLCLGATCLGLFLLRYVGAFSLSLMGLALLVSLYRGDYRAAILNAILLVIVGSLIGLYLRNNVLLTGYATGMPRLPPSDTPAARFAMLVSAAWSVAILPLTEFQPRLWLAWSVVLIEVVGLVAMGTSIRRHYFHPVQVVRVDALSLSFLSVGIFYLSAIIVLRWLTQFDPYNFRLLAPGTLMLILAALRVALLSWPSDTGRIAAFIGTMAALSIAIVSVEILTSPGPGYFATAQSIERRYALVPSGSIILFGNEHLRYLRPDLFITMPVCLPWFDGTQSWNEFLSQLDRRRPIFVDISDSADEAGRCQSSVRAFLARHRSGELFQLDLR